VPLRGRATTVAELPASASKPWRRSLASTRTSPLDSTSTACLRRKPRERRVLRPRVVASVAAAPVLSTSRSTGREATCVRTLGPGTISSDADPVGRIACVSAELSGFESLSRSEDSGNSRRAVPCRDTPFPRWRDEWSGRCSGTGALLSLTKALVAPASRMRLAMGQVLPSYLWRAGRDWPGSSVSRTAAPRCRRRRRRSSAWVSCAGAHDGQGPRHADGALERPPPPECPTRVSDGLEHDPPGPPSTGQLQAKHAYPTTSHTWRQTC
jgi:hypothetical protein